MIYGNLIQEERDKLLVVNEPINLAACGAIRPYINMINSIAVSRYIDANDLDGLLDVYRALIDKLNKKESEIGRILSGIRPSLSNSIMPVVSNPLYYAQGKPGHEKIFDPNGRVLSLVYECGNFRKSRHLLMLHDIDMIRMELNTYAKQNANDPEIQRRIKEANRVYDRYVRIVKENMKGSIR